MSNAKLEALQQEVESLKQIVEGIMTSHEELRTTIADGLNDLRGALNGFEFESPEEEDDDAQRAARIGLIQRVADLEVLTSARNRSAPVKKNMTDEDAESCLQGETKDLGHKEAGEQLGLTYAQVYSCRLEYTFKHVHKRLKEGGWKNPWVKR